MDKIWHRNAYRIFNCADSFCDYGIGCAWYSTMFIIISQLGLMLWSIQLSEFAIEEKFFDEDGKRKQKREEKEAFWNKIKGKK